MEQRPYLIYLFIQDLIITKTTIMILTSTATIKKLTNYFMFLRICKYYFSHFVHTNTYSILKTLLLPLFY